MISKSLCNALAENFQNLKTGRDPADWSLIGWLYNDVYYTSTADFRAAWSSPGFEKAGVHNQEGEWTNPTFDYDYLPLDEKPFPLAVSPGEARFEVDYDNQYVKWMDFEFYVAFTRNTGVRLFDIKYKGQRIMYELGLEEAYVILCTHFSGQKLVSDRALQYRSLCWKRSCAEWSEFGRSIREDCC